MVAYGPASHMCAMREEPHLHATAVAIEIQQKKGVLGR